MQRIVALDPRTEPQETPIKAPTRNEYGWVVMKERGVDTSTE